jgi:hypothetical protein
MKWWSYLCDRKTSPFLNVCDCTGMDEWRGYVWKLNVEMGLDYFGSPANFLRLISFFYALLQKKV